MDSPEDWMKDVDVEEQLAILQALSASNQSGSNKNSTQANALQAIKNANVNEQIAIHQKTIDKKNVDVRTNDRTKVASDFSCTSSTSLPISRPPDNCLTHPDWELIDPTPDVRALFIAWDKRFFSSRLQSSGVVVEWSPRMTLCAGLCVYEGYGGLCSVRLSTPLLKLRPRSDLVNTLLHEMIHAFLFVTHNNRDRDGHGDEFHRHMYRINAEAGTRITVYHSFHDEVRSYKVHWWRCNGPCQQRSPFFGWVKRAMNRAPGPNDTWWAEHRASCQGEFIKVREPDPVVKKTGRSSSSSADGASKPKSKRPKIITPPSSDTSKNMDLRNFFLPKTELPNQQSNIQQLSSSSSNNKLTAETATPSSTSSTNNLNPTTVTAAFQGSGQRLGGTSSSGMSRLLDAFTRNAGKKT